MNIIETTTLIIVMIIVIIVGFSIHYLNNLYNRWNIFEINYDNFYKDIENSAKKSIDEYKSINEKSKKYLSDLELSIIKTKQSISKSSRDIKSVIESIEKEKIREEIMREESYIHAMEDRINRLQKIKGSRDLEVVSVISRMRISDIESKILNIKEIVSQSIERIEHGHVLMIYDGINLNECKEIVSDLYKLQLGKRQINHASIENSKESSWLEINGYISANEIQKITVATVKKNKVTYSCSKEQYDNFICLYNNFRDSRISDIELIERMINELSQKFSHLLHESESIANQINISDVI